MKKKKIIKITLLSLAAAVLLIVLAGGSYVAYVAAEYSRIENLYEPPTENNTQLVLAADGSFSVVTYNIGFGAYDKDFSFFMDTGKMKDGTEVKGKHSKAASKNTVLKNTMGSVNAAKNLDADFYFFQEVDTASTRSYHVNQYEMLKDIGQAYSYTFAQNFHSAYLLYPLNDFHGKVNSGIATLSKYKIDISVRYSFPVDESFPNKFFDLDRCFLLSRIPVDNGKELVLINLHMSAYDEGGKIRARQLELLKTVLTEEYNKGNYVIAGGDFNHDIAGSVDYFESNQQTPEWVSVMSAADLPANFLFASSLNAPTCRSSDLPYQKGVNYTVVIDGFLASDNVIIEEVLNIDLDFTYSDHNPVRFTFKLA